MCLCTCVLSYLCDERDFAASSEIAACITQRCMQQAACSKQRKVQHAASAQSTCSEASTPLERFINRSKLNGGNHTKFTGPFVPGARALHFLYIHLYRLVWPRSGQRAPPAQQPRTTRTRHGPHPLASRTRSPAPPRQSPPPVLLHRLAAPYLHGMRAMPFLV